MELTIAYVTLCVAVALFGRTCRIGFWGVLLFSFFVTPVLVFYGLLGLRPAGVQSKPAKVQLKRWWKFKETV